MSAAKDSYISRRDVLADRVSRISLVSWHQATNFNTNGMKYQACVTISPLIAVPFPPSLHQRQGRELYPLIPSHLWPYW